LLTEWKEGAVVEVNRR